jgi:NADH-quinone oxidoreductase subunit L
MDIRQAPTLSLILLALPLAGFAVRMLAGGTGAPDAWSERNQRRAVGLSRVSTAIAGAALLLAIWIAVAVLAAPAPAGRPGYYPKAWLGGLLFDLHDGGAGVGGVSTTIGLGLLADDTAAVMLVVVTLIALLVHLYSGRFMPSSAHGGRLDRYFALLGLFTFAMLGVVISGDLLLLFIFWVLLSLSSSLLIGFHHERPAAQAAALKMLVANVIGDAAAFAGIAILFAQLGTLRYASIFDLIASGRVPSGSGGWLTAAGLLLFCGVAGKSAQFPLNVWLPDAMEAPMPAAALLHGSALTAAGIYLLARIAPLLTGDALHVIAVAGAITALLGASVATVQWAMKRTLAYVTLAQLGLMVMTLGLGAYSAALALLMTWMIGGAALFLATGSLLHGVRAAIDRAGGHAVDPDDVRILGGLRGKMPLTYAAMLASVLAIAGAPLFGGYLSRSAALTGAVAIARIDGGVLSVVLCAAGYAVSGLTAFALFRLLLLIFHGAPRDAKLHEQMGESPRAMTVPLLVLAVLSLWLPFGPNPLDASSSWLAGALAAPVSSASAPLHAAAGTDAGVGPMPRPLASAEFRRRLDEEVDRLDGTGLPHLFPLPSVAALLVVAIGFFAAFRLYGRGDVKLDRTEPRGARALLAGGLRQDEIYERYFPIGLVHLLAKAAAWSDQNIIEGMVNGIGAAGIGVARLAGTLDVYVVDGIVSFLAGTTQFLGMMMRQLQTGKIQTYVVYIVIGVVILFFVFR